MPEALRYVWDWYLELCHGERLNHAEIAAWCQLTGTRLLPWETRLLRSLDRKHKEVMNDD